MIRKWAITGFGLGLAPVASGTFGSAGACAISLAAWFIVGPTTTVPNMLDAVWVVLLLLWSVACVVWGPWAIAEYANKARKQGDPGAVVADEFAGQWIALIGFAMPTLQQALIVLAMQFFLFRLFDVLKVFPANKLEKLPAGWGILTDDLAAGVYANVVGQLILRFIL